jgi:UDP-GlcNAc:undecaprenyl-phosphate GlcNAc-1-phosphate transferase
MIPLQMVLAFATALVLALAIIPLVSKLSAAYGLLDVPDGGHVAAAGGGGRRVHSLPVPRLGGIGIAVAFAVSVLVWTGVGPLAWLLGPSILIFAVGLIDDLHPLSAKLRFFAQVAVSGTSISLGDVWIKSVVLSPEWQFAVPAWVGIPLSIFVVVGAINAINMIDGLDGLAGGVVLIGIVLLTYLHVLTTGSLGLLAGVSLPLIGGILGFLRYNTHPATIFMGDGGSNWLGFMTGMIMLIVLAEQPVLYPGVASNLLPELALAQTKGIPILTVILCLAVPVFDTACVIINRARHGQHPMQADKRHFHHTLLRLGLSHPQSVAAVYFVALSAGILGLAPVAFAKYNLEWVPPLVSLGIALLFPLGLQASKNPERMLISGLLDSRARAMNNQVRKLLRLWESTNRYTIYGILLLAPVLAGAPPAPVGRAAGLVAAGLALVIVMKKGATDLLQSLALALAITTLLIANNTNQIMIEFDGARHDIQGLYNAVFIWLAASTAGFVVATARRNYLVVKPSDFLLVCIPLVLILIPEPFRTDYRLNVIGLRALVVFAAILTMVKRHQYSLRRFSVIALAGLVYAYLAGVWGMKFVG